MNKEELRSAMPFTAAKVDEIRRVFGEIAKIKATENGHVVEWKAKKCHSQ